MILCIPTLPQKFEHKEGIGGTWHDVVKEWKEGGGDRNSAANIVPKQKERWVKDVDRELNWGEEGNNG